MQEPGLVWRGVGERILCGNAVPGQNVLRRAHVIADVHVGHLEESAAKNKQRQAANQEEFRPVERFQRAHSSWPPAIHHQKSRGKNICQRSHARIEIVPTG